MAGPSSDTSGAAASAAAEDECGQCEPNVRERLFDAFPEEPLPPGWQVIRHGSDYPFYVHLQSKATMWSMPYVVPEDAQLETHPLPSVVRRTLQAMPGMASKRPRPEPTPKGPPKAPPTLVPRGPPGEYIVQMPPTPVPSKEERRRKPRPATLPSTVLNQVGPNGQKRAIHPGCPAFDIDITGKTPVSILNEFCPKVLRCPVEFIVTTQEDPVNPYLTSIVCEGVVVAKVRNDLLTPPKISLRSPLTRPSLSSSRVPAPPAKAGYSSKRTSRQLAARKALAIFAPLLDIGAADFDEAVASVDTGGGVMGAVSNSAESLEAKEEMTLNLPLHDDRILENTIGKTPVMVLQEHCHKHVGKLPTYSSVANSAVSNRSLPLYRVTVALYTGECASGASARLGPPTSRSSLPC